MNLQKKNQRRPVTYMDGTDKRIEMFFEILNIKSRYQNLLKGVLKQKLYYSILK